MLFFDTESVLRADGWTAASIAAVHQGRIICHWGISPYWGNLPHARQGTVSGVYDPGTIQAMLAEIAGEFPRHCWSGFNVGADLSALTLAGVQIPARCRDARPPIMAAIAQTRRYRVWACSHVQTRAGFAPTRLRDLAAYCGLGPQPHNAAGDSLLLGAVWAIAARRKRARPRTQHGLLNPC